jgi:hypothetical protein
MYEIKIPPVPIDVLEALGTLPAEKLAQIETKVIAWSLEEAIRNPTEKNSIKMVIKVGRKHTALIRQAVREMAEERGREG